MTYQPSDPKSDRRPLPPEIYMRRRIAALVVLLVLVALVIWGLTAAARSGSDNTEPTPSPVPESITTEPTVPVPGESTAAPTTSSAASSTAPSAGPSKPSADAAAKKECTLQDLKITARASESSYGPGQQPTFYMTVENPTAVDCAIDLNAEQLRFEVYDMASNQRVWSDTDCHPAVVTGEETFAPDKARDFEAIWSRKDSQPGRCSDRQDVPAGSYYLHAVIGSHASDPADFTLRS